MKDVSFKIIDNTELAKDVFRMILDGDTSDIILPGQFVNIKIEGKFLRRPISVCDSMDGLLVLIYKVVGTGAKIMSEMKEGESLQILTGLGNGYNTAVSGDRPLLLGGGVGVPPLFMLAKELIAEGKKPFVILGFNKKEEIFYEEDFRRIGADVVVTTADGSYGTKGFVTDAFPEDYTYFYTCGPEPMLRAVYKATKTEGQFSFEARMGCGFGACMGCSCKTITGNKRICKEGPVIWKEDIIWED